jgi:hypothetical protein
VLGITFGPKDDELSEQFWILRNEELRYLCKSPSIIVIVKHRRLRLANHVARLREKTNSESGRRVTGWKANTIEERERGMWLLWMLVK